MRLPPVLLGGRRARSHAYSCCVIGCSGSGGARGARGRAAACRAPQWHGRRWRGVNLENSSPQARVPRVVALLLAEECKRRNCVLIELRRRRIHLERFDLERPPRVWRATWTQRILDHPSQSLDLVGKHGGCHAELGPQHTQGDLSIVSIRLETLHLSPQALNVLLKRRELTERAEVQTVGMRRGARTKGKVRLQSFKPGHQ